MANRYLVISDLHLADVEDHEDGWKFYKGSHFLCDRELAGLLEKFTRSTSEEDNPVLVLNGDIFDFDLVTAAPEEPPWEVSSSEKRRGLKATAEKSAWKLEKILADHRPFTEALAEFLDKGHEIVYVLGNHDTEFYFEAVQEAFKALIANSDRYSGAAGEGMKIRFEPWFYYKPEEIYIEHGHQYDYYTSARYILDPRIEQAGEMRLALPMGNLSNRYLMSRMGYFNPHSQDYILNLFHYAAHWLKYYAFSRHSLFLNWFWGSLLVLGRMLRIKKELLKEPEGYRERVAAFRREKGLTEEQLAGLSDLQRAPITNKFFRMLREFWIDRLLLALIMTGGTIALALVPIPLWIKLMVPLSSFPLVYLLYEAMVKGETVFTVEEQIPKYARRITELLEVPVVVFGHTHVAHLLPLDKGVSFVSSGTWAPITTKGNQREALKGYQNYLIVSKRQGRVQLEFDCWPQGKNS